MISFQQFTRVAALAGYETSGYTLLGVCVAFIYYRDPKNTRQDRDFISAHFECDLRLARYCVILSLPSNFQRHAGEIAASD
jgi:hypothetical protein